MPKVKVIFCFCVHPDCEWCNFYAFTTGRPRECQSCGNPVGAEFPQMVDPDDVDEIVRIAAAARPAWNQGRQKEIRKRSTSIGGTITCALCNGPIKVNSDGKEEWISRSGNLHATLPHTDHVDPWVGRKSNLYSDPAYLAADEVTKKTMEREAFNASPLQTTHMSCNCMKGAT